MPTVQAVSKSSLERWQDGLKASVKSPRWNAWDCDVQAIISQYNRHLAGQAGYMPLDWKIIKAMLWVETGANNAEWTRKPMQIGVPGDPGLKALLSSHEGGNLILPPAFSSLTSGSARAIPSHNIRAGVGYLLMRMATFEERSVVGPDAAIQEVTIKAGDSLAAIAKTHGTTVELLTRLNPGTGVLQPGRTLRYQKASLQRVIRGWRAFSTQNIANRYNGGGDPFYAKKLDFALSLVRQGRVAQCVR
jgi:hypothetical protein